GALNGSVVRFDNFSIASNKGLQRYAFWCRESQINSDTVFGSFSVAHAQDSLTVTDVPGQQFPKPLVAHLAGQAQLGRTIPLPCARLAFLGVIVIGSVAIVGRYITNILPC